MPSPSSAFSLRPGGSPVLFRTALGFAPALLVLACGTAHALDRTWIGGDADWLDNGAATNWSPNDEPDADDRAIFNTANSVSLGSNNSVNGLALSGEIDLLTADFDLTVDGLTELAGTSTSLNIGGATSLLNTDDLTINSGATIELAGGSLTLDEESGTSLLDINAGGFFVGNGTVTFADVPGGITTQWFNDGTLTALSRSEIIFGSPPVGTLSISAAGANARIDLDGAGEAGVVNVNRNQTLDLNVALADPFNGSLSLFHESTFDSSAAWSMSGGTIEADNGFVDNSFPLPDIAAGTSTIAGASFTQLGGTISVVDGDGTLKFGTAFTMSSGTLNNNGLVIFDGNAVIAAGANFNMDAPASSLTVEAARTLDIQQTNFNLDGPIIGGSVVTVNSGGTLTITSNDYDSDSVVNAYNGILNLNSGTVVTNTGDAEFVMDGVLNMNNTTGTAATWNGEPVDIGNDSGSLNADLNVLGTGFHDFVADVDFNSDADVDIAAAATLRFLSSATVNFDTVNAANNAEFTGSGAMVFNGSVNVNEAATLNLAGGSVDLDGTDSVGDFINIDAPFAINAASLTSFGRSNMVGTNTLDINNSVGTGVLIVTLDNPSTEWTLNPAGVMNLVNDNTEATLLSGSAINLNGTVNVTGDVRSAARVDLAGTLVINTAAQPFRLGGGNNTTSPNTIAGGAISGAGLLGADDGRALTGFGSIGPSVDFDGNSDLLADDGTLTVNGTILDVRNVGTADGDGTLDVVNAWNSAAASMVLMQGGALQGGTITLDNVNGIVGRGTVSSRVINNTRLNANSPGNSLLLQTAGNDNDWDGSGVGQLMAQGGTLDLRDTGPAFGFTGTVMANTGGRVFANGFALDFNPGSFLQLDNGTYESTSSTDIGGTVTVNGATPSTIKVANNFFLTFETGSTTTLNQNLMLMNNNIIIEAGATFSGIGAVVIPNGSHMVMEHGANANVLLDMQGALRPGNSEGIGQVTVKDFQGAASGELYMEIAGAALNQYDRVSVNGIAVIDGHLNLDIDGGFVPSIGQTFNILSASGGVIGNFDALDVSGMPAGLTFKINYLPTIVQVEVISGSEFETWIHLFTSITNPSDRLKTADPDQDGLNNLVEFALDGHPASGASTGKVVAKIAPVGGVNALTLTFPARYANSLYDPPGGEFLVVGLTTPALHYKAQASDDLVTFALTVDDVTGADAIAIQAGLPPLSPGWQYITCRSPGPVAGDPAEFMRLDIAEGPFPP